MIKNSHLTLTDRCMIERMLTFGYSFKEIGASMNRHPSTISREIRNHREFIQPQTQSKSKSNCANFSTCIQRKVCGNKNCFKPCKCCNEVSCQKHCKEYSSIYCSLLEKMPYVCNNCTRQEFCHRGHAYYHANKSHAKYLSKLSESRNGVRASDEELQKLDQLVSPLIQKGQSLSHIFASHADDIGYSRRTIYNYIDKSVLSARNIDLPRKVRYRKRKSKPKEPFPYKYRIGRTYNDFLSYMQQHPDIGTVEMDTVKGTREKGNVLLTMLFVKYDFMLIFLMPSASQECVSEVFDRLTNSLGLALFQKYFAVILTDNGCEFKDVIALEHTNFATERTRIFYCDPMASWQKPHIEKNHEFIRCVLPKGRSLDTFTQDDITLLTNHINSVARDSLDGICPFLAAKDFLGRKIPAVLNLKQIEPDEVLLKPGLLRN